MAKAALIIEDEPVIAEFVKKFLEGEGYAVRIWDTGRGDYEEIQRTKPSLLLLDIMLPHFDGYTLILKLSKDAATARLPVVVMTTVANAKDLFEKFPQVKGFLPKPFRAEDVLRALEKAS